MVTHQGTHITCSVCKTSSKLPGKYTELATNSQALKIALQLGNAERDEQKYVFFIHFYLKKSLLFYSLLFFISRSWCLTCGVANPLCQQEAGHSVVGMVEFMKQVGKVETCLVVEVASQLRLALKKNCKSGLKFRL